MNKKLEKTSNFYIVVFLMFLFPILFFLPPSPSRNWRNSHPYLILAVASSPALNSRDSLAGYPNKLTGDFYTIIASSSVISQRPTFYFV